MIKYSLLGCKHSANTKSAAYYISQNPFLAMKPW
jgi:hypothetical protein